jgi:peptide/nickel transport system substrate-binding protein
MTKKLLFRGGALALAGVIAVTLAACSGGGSGTASGTASTTAVKGGTVTWLDVTGAFEATDPVGVYIGEELAGFRRIVYRGLTALPISADKNPKVVPDLATTTGTTKDAGKTWSYTLKKGLKWQDGTPITCADLQYGLSRSYDANLVAGGGGVGLTYFGDGGYNLIDPSDPSYDLATEYTGPLTGSAAAQAHFDKAASCSGNTITYHFENAWPDFPYAAAALFSTDPYEKSFDKGAANLFTINSDGPYKLSGTFTPTSGGTFVRNPEYSASTDSVKVRGAYPNTIKFEFVSDVETVTERLIAASGPDSAAFTPLNIPSDKYSEISSAQASRTMTTTSPYTRFLEINSNTLTDPNVRNALIKATDQAGVIKAEGGSKWGTPTSTIVAGAIPGWQKNPSTASNNPNGDPAAAKALLAGKTPTIRFAFADTSTVIEQVAAVLQQGWEKAGFKVTLDPISKDAKPGYYAQVGSDPKPIDVFFAGWAADWPSLFAVVPPILQSNPTGATFGVGFNYGFFKNSKVDSLIKQATASTVTATQQKLLNEADQVAEANGAYVPLAQQNNYFIYGSKIGGFLPDVASSYYPDLGGIYVKK